MKFKLSLIPFALAFLFLLVGTAAIGQNRNEITATLVDSTKSITIKQKTIYTNTSETALEEIYFNDWNHAYSSKKTPLAVRFGDAFKRTLHLAKNKNRGITTIISFVDVEYSGLEWERTPNQDLVKVNLNKPLERGESITLYINYIVKLPNAKFTSYGFKGSSGYYLTDWYLTPAVFKDGTWSLYSNVNLNDLYTNVVDTRVNFTFPNTYFLATNYDAEATNEFLSNKHVLLNATAQKSCKIVLTKEKQYVKHITPDLTITTNLNDDRYSEVYQSVSINKITKFIADNLGAYPHKNLLVTETDYNKSPLYGINQLPSFVRPYSQQFQFELKLLKTTLNNFVEETLFLDKRKERWVNDAIVNYLMIKYVNTFYPDQKLTGKLSKLWGFRSYNLAKQSFNDQYYLLQMFMVRRNQDQALSTPNDSLIWFNHKIANRYKAGLGLAYLGEYIDEKNIDNTILDFYQQYKLKPLLKAENFNDILRAKSDKDIDWFFKEYVDSRNIIDFKIKKAKIENDSITVNIKNKKGSNVPISLFGLKKDSVISKYWLKGIDSLKTVKIPYNGEKRLVLNYDKKIPESNQRDNWKNLGGFLASNKKLKFTFFKDIENPYYNQIFYVPEVRFNVDNGLTPILKITNKTFLERPFIFSVAPGYSFIEESLIGSAGFRIRKNHQNEKLNFTTYSFGIRTSFFDENSRFTTITPAVSFSWRPEDRNSNKSQSLLIRSRNVIRDIDENIVDEIDTDPDFSVLNLRYGEIDNNTLNFKRWRVDAQLADQFSRVSFEWERRKLFDNNRQLNLRFFAGKFITNNADSDFFSFALDRPSDYLFDLNYLTRSDNAGLASQQIIIAEGGFKSLFDDRFGNDWIVSGNASFNIWQWIELYGDIGAIKNKNENARFVYDSGVRLNLVTDFFELYFPVYSNNGFEISQPNYENRIRFVVTLSPKTISRLLTRKWF